ncbi:MAG: glycosyltransferase family 2 protein [Cyanobacteriota bacterium]
MNLRELAGVILKDCYRYQSFIGRYDDSYLRITNRLERIEKGPRDLGYVCLWPHTSKLHAPRVIPELGKKLLTRCVDDNCFQMNEQRSLGSDIQISVLIGHRGLSRLPLLLATLKSIRSQIDIQLECIVIEQDRSPQIKKYLPKWVNHIFLETDTDSLIYNRSAAFNFGARHAHGRILLLHDNDMLMPVCYCKNILAIAKTGYEAINTKRYVFYMCRQHTERILRSFNQITSYPPEYIVQNLEAGGSMAITKEAYREIGGMDENFVGWGGEDIEFWKRCSLLKRWIWGYEPIIHLWHPSQPLKESTRNPNIERMQLLADTDLYERIESLKRTFDGQS